MFVWIAKLILNAFALSIVSQIVPGVHISEFMSALVAVVVISLVNMFVRPVLFFLTLPVTILTLGLFTFVLNAMMFSIAGAVTPGLTVDGFGPALWGSLAYSLISTVLLWLVK